LCKKGGGIMTEKQKRFCEEYLVDCNATQAAIRAGYSPKTAYSIGNENLNKPEIKTYIDEQLEKNSSAKIATAREVMEHLTAVMNGEVKEQALIWIGDGEQDITEIAVSEKDRLKAAELLGKRYGLFTDNVKLDGTARIVFEGESELDD
jgi:phage terminase small subunit